MRDIDYLVAVELGFIWAILWSRWRRIRKTESRLWFLERAAHVTLPDQGFSAAWHAGCMCPACCKAQPPLVPRTPSDPLEDDRPVGEVLPPGIFPTGRHPVVKPGVAFGYYPETRRGDRW